MKKSKYVHITEEGQLVISGNINNQKITISAKGLKKSNGTILFFGDQTTILL